MAMETIDTRASLSTALVGDTAHVFPSQFACSRQKQLNELHNISSRLCLVFVCNHIVTGIGWSPKKGIRSCEKRETTDKNARLTTSSISRRNVDSLSQAFAVSAPRAGGAETTPIKTVAFNHSGDTQYFG
jgi:hypothetical protein